MRLEGGFPGKYDIPSTLIGLVVGTMSRLSRTLGTLGWSFSRYKWKSLKEEVREGTGRRDLFSAMGRDMREEIKRFFWEKRKLKIKLLVLFCCEEKR